MTQRIVVVGGGGFGREVVDVVDAMRQAGGDIEVIGFLDDGLPDLDVWEPYGVPHLGGVCAIATLPQRVGYVIAVGDPRTRRRLDESLRSSGRSCPILVHPNAHIARAVEIGVGSIICSHVSITNNIRLGRHVHVNLNCTIGHDARLGDFVTLSPLVAVSGNVSLEDAVFVGTGATLNPSTRIGAGAVVASGATVLRDVESAATVAGVPAKRIS